MSSMEISKQTLQALEQEAGNYQWIDDDQSLAELCQQWRQHPLLALDTEFQRTDTFYPIPGLIQVASAGKCYLLDPLKISDFSPFIALMQDPQVLKVLHACSEDLELFNHCYGVVPAPMFDCQVACSFLGMGLSIGYQRLLATLFEVEVDKEETRSDWLQRPLTDSQKIYAAIDVVYLETIYQLLEQRLREQNKYDWVLEDCQTQAEAACEEEDYQLSYLQRFKQSWKLRPQNLAVLQALSAWREAECRQRDMPRNFLLHNHSMMAIAMKPPFSMSELSAVERMRGRSLSNDGKTILEIVKKAWGRPAEEYPLPPPRPLPAQWSKRLKSLKALINETAERLELAPEMLVRRKDLEKLTRSGMDDGCFELPAELMGWRKGVIGEALVQRLKSSE
ncbi:MAG: ribonuclease D [Motiliproteus sp.]|nr:ribonuclease D [Motiliproteus sp.]MCW9053339.1 ribonuclease D [Motiliproteus sp.]